MEYRNLGNTDVKVSAICLGTMTWGEQNTISEAHQQLDFALERGINFIDTAEMYPVPPKAETYTKTEEIIGKWDKLKSKRDEIILATKIVGPAEMCAHVRGGKPDLDSDNIHRALDSSLERLGVDYIDLYQIHWPSRSTNFFGQRGFSSGEYMGVPIEQTLEALSQLVESKKVRYIGISNETPWGMHQYIMEACKTNFPKIVSVQNPYNLLNRTYEVGMAEMSIRENAGLLAYSPLAFGTLSGKYLGGKKPPRARLTLWDRFSRYSSDTAITSTEKYVDIAKKYGLDPSQMALSFVTSRSFVTSNIIGATTMDQLKTNIGSIDVTLSSEVISEIEAVHEMLPNPCP
ncbi:MAG: NADP(H)-dependent aldo-keto reductase [Bacteriovoracaceae bacterium]|nr:NADP(H)-dependent aldo-keto reductase [Bacteriovoracaceae bacterium]